MNISNKTALLAAAILIFPALAQAKPTPQEQNQFQLCSMISYLNYNAMQGYQTGLSQTKNRSALVEKFVTPAPDAQAKTVFTQMIDTSLAEIYKLPKGASAEEQEELSKLLAVSALKGCADKFGLDLDKFKHN